MIMAIKETTSRPSSRKWHKEDGKIRFYESKGGGDEEVMIHVCKENFVF